MDRKKNLMFEKREAEGVKDRVRMTFPCVIRAQREMKEWRHREHGYKEESWSSVHSEGVHIQYFMPLISYQKILEKCIFP